MSLYLSKDCDNTVLYSIINQCTILFIYYYYNYIITMLFYQGDVIIEAKGVTKAYGDKLLMNNLDFSIPPGAIVGVIGK